MSSGALPTDRRLLAALCLALALTLGVKVQAFQRGVARDQTSFAAERGIIFPWLERHGFRARAARASPFIEAQSGSCRLTLMAVDAKGYHRAMIARLDPRHAARYFLYRGAAYDFQPLWHSWIDHQRWARARDLGLHLPRHLVLGIVAVGCPELSWDELPPVA